MKETLQFIWRKITSEYTDNIELIDLYWQEIEAKYTSVDRYYHNLDHLQFMLDNFKTIKNEIKYPDSLCFTIFYHDIIYSTQNTDNEIKSAEIARDRLALINTPDHIIERCVDQILSTKYHKTSLDSDTNYLLDLDLLILGSKPEKYLEYTQNIRKEYAIYNDKEYTAGRLKVVQHFLDMDYIFKTHKIRSRFEDHAHHNLKQELNLLSR